MAVLIELLTLLVLEYLIAIPGAFLRWVYFRLSGKKVLFRNYLANSQYGLSTLTTIALIGIVVLVARLA